ncbi:MAG TPA: GAF domain-containing protein, partial [Egibacteraceae bacterium]|nr:GAF domain-containing protein [Egibacteraceae bacterium]
LGDVPTQLLLSAKGHVDNLVREFALAAGGAASGTTAAVPAHLAQLIDTVVHRFAEARDSIKRQALAAARQGHDHLRLELRLPVSAARAGEEYLAALDQADAYCRAARLLTLESPPQHRVFRRWYVGELVAQLRQAAEGHEPAPAETFEERLLREIDAFAAAERTAERFARLHSLSAALASAGTPEAVTEAVLREGVAALGATGGAVLVASPAGELAVPTAVGYGEQVMARLRAESPDAELPAAVALRTGEPVWLESREARDARFPELEGVEPGTLSMCAVPLIVDGRTVGAMRFSFSRNRLFDAEERDFIDTMAAQTAQALDRALMYRQWQEPGRRPPGAPGGGESGMGIEPT